MWLHTLYFEYNITETILLGLMQSKAYFYSIFGMALNWATTALTLKYMYVCM